MSLETDNETSKVGLNSLMALRQLIYCDDSYHTREFWDMWIESLPFTLDSEYYFSTSACGHKVSWRAQGPQNAYIQKMVDFFWNVGSPESQIDRLGDIGAVINPCRIGSWIDMSLSGGMDGGWVFAGNFPLKIALTGADVSDPSQKLLMWSEKHGITSCIVVGRDMGAGIPHQTWTLIELPGNLSEQLTIGIQVFSELGFPPIPESVLNIICKETTTAGLMVSVVFCAEGFVKLALQIPSPSSIMVEQLCQIAGGSLNYIEQFNLALATQLPSFVECQFLKSGYGYNVYKEGFDIVFSYCYVT